MVHKRESPSAFKRVFFPRHMDQAEKQKKELKQIRRDGFSPALVSLIGHSLATTSATWMYDPNSARPERYRILTSSWDQSVAMHDVDLLDKEAFM